MHLTDYKLGKQGVKHDARTFKLSNYMLHAAAKPHPLRRVNWINGVTNLGMMGNDNAGDCTTACLGHLIELWTLKESGREVVIPDKQILQSYTDVTGIEGAAYDPATGANDNGCNILDVLNYARKTGVGGHKISAFMSIDPKNHDEVKIAIQLFGGIDIGLALPLSAQSEVGQTWTVPTTGLTGDGAPGSWGGHCVPTVAYFADQSLTVVTWGALQQMTWEFWDAYCDEVYAIISPDWVAKNGANPQGFNLAQLQADLAALK